MSTYSRKYLKSMVDDDLTNDLVSRMMPIKLVYGQMLCLI